MKFIIKSITAFIITLITSGCASTSDNNEMHAAGQCRVVIHEDSNRTTSNKSKQITTTQSVPPEHELMLHKDENDSESQTKNDQGYFLIFPNQYYIGGGSSRGVALDSEAADKPAESNFNLLFGMRLSPDWALEFNYFFPSDAPFKDEGINIEYKQWEIAGKYDLNLTNHLGLYARLGTAKWDLEKKLPDDPHFQTNFKSDGWSLIFEGGVFYRITDDFTIQGGYHFTPSIGDSSNGEFTSRRLMVNLTWDFGFEETAIFISED
ncbi:porin family protein [Vibrio sp. 1CM2L]|uniref:outer membrane beta-barrel protein n=1 Tax=Vibrio sp. 1CM2L TaxID=2929166 RepID=UPI0020BDEADE|nr:outer membrane beta-barrel protein [Vibrio sp. 1CM2L]MCK8075875.1 porin family protein [Vibrio sp. 1CM2L]